MLPRLVPLKRIELRHIVKILLKRWVPIGIARILVYISACLTPLLNINITRLQVVATQIMLLNMV